MLVAVKTKVDVGLGTTGVKTETGETEIDLVQPTRPRATRMMAWAACAEFLKCLIIPPRVESRLITVFA